MTVSTPMYFDYSALHTFVKGNKVDFLKQSVKNLNQFKERYAQWIKLNDEKIASCLNNEEIAELAKRNTNLTTLIAKVEYAIIIVNRNTKSTEVVEDVKVEEVIETLEDKLNKILLEDKDALDNFISEYLNNLSKQDYLVVTAKALSTHKLKYSVKVKVKETTNA